MRTGSSTVETQHAASLLGDHSLVPRDRFESNAITTSSSGVRNTEIRYMPWGDDEVYLWEQPDDPSCLGTGYLNPQCRVSVAAVSCFAIPVGRLGEGRGIV
jgi:hypothetical protein